MSPQDLAVLIREYAVDGAALPAWAGGGMRVGSLFSGYGGLDLAVGGDLSWVSDIEPTACSVLAEHHPSVPNLGDIKKVDWSKVEPVDVLTGGYPCQPFSTAGARMGTNDERHLFPYVQSAIESLRPSWVVLENVRGHLTLGFRDVLSALHDVGYDARWGVVRASDAGAPHRRERVFIVARPADASRGTRGERSGRGVSESERATRLATHAGSLAADANSGGHGEQQDARAVGRVEGHSEGETQERQRPRGESDAGGDIAAADASGCDAQESVRAGSGCGNTRRLQHRDSSDTDWGKYAPAIHRWESVLGRPAPSPTIPGTNGRPRLSPVFVEWMMGLPAGHVTGHGLRPAQELKMLGNGVVPQQARLALDHLAGAA